MGEGFEQKLLKMLRNVHNMWFDWNFCFLFASQGTKMDTTTQSKIKNGWEKQEHLVKLAILTIAAILCKWNEIFH